MFVSVDIQTIALLLPLATSPKHDACYWASLLFGSFDRDRELGEVRVATRGRGRASLSTPIA